MRTFCGIILVLAFAMASPAIAQRASDWRTFKASDGLAESFIASVTVSQRTNVWVKHYNVNAVSHLNGYKTRTIQGPDRGSFRIHESRSGQIWSAYASGLQEYKNGVWIKYPINSIRQEFETNVLRHARSIPIVPLKQGNLVFLLSDRLMHFSSDSPHEIETRTLRDVRQTRIGKFSDMTLGRDGTLWIIGDHGLLRLTNGVRLTPESAWEEFLLDSSAGLHNLQQAFADDFGGLTTVAQSINGQRKVVAHFDGKRWSFTEPGNHQIRQAWKRPDGRFWAVSINALLRQEWDGSWSEDRDVPAIQFFDVATEANGVFWLATSEGLLRYSPALWQAPADFRAVGGSVRAMGEQNEGGLWVATAEGINLLKGRTWQKYPFPQAFEQPFSPGEFIFPVGKGKLVIGVDGRLLCFAMGTGVYTVKSHPSGASVKPLGSLPDGALCVQVVGKSKEPRLEAFDGRNFAPFPFGSPPSEFVSTPTVLFSTSLGELWLGSENGMAHLTNGNWQKVESDLLVPESPTCFNEINVGKVWCGTRNAIWESSAGGWTLLRSGFDRVNAIVQTRDGAVWVASNSGLFRFQQGEWTDYVDQDGLPANAITSIFEERSGQIWAGTTRGLARFLPQSDLHAPRCFVTKIDTAEEGSVRISFNGIDKWNVTPPERLLFSYRLNEKDWSPFSGERSVSFHDLAAGTHYFQVRAMDRNRNIDPQPALLDFEVMLPWYQETRLLLISIAGLAVALFFAAIAFNRHRTLLRSYAEVEKIVEVRTKQLEQANAQLLHSQKMTALGALAAGVAHDFNSILSIIKGSAQIIETNLDDRNKIKVRAERIKTAVDQGSEVIKAMLGFSRPGENTNVECDVNRLVADTVQLLGDRFERDIQVIHKARQLPTVYNSPNLIQQILLNFLLNAADAMDGKGKVEIIAETATELPGNIVLAPETARLYVALSVRDNGCGISPEMLPRVFEPFFTTKAFSSRRGTGLGLSMVYELAKEMECGLSVKSAPGTGSTFTLIIPASGPSTNDSRDGAVVPGILETKIKTGVKNNE